MRIISRKKFREFYDKHPESKSVFDTFVFKLSQARAANIAELRAAFPAADAVGDCTVFNVSGNNYRVITYVRYYDEAVFIRFVLTHTEYSTQQWKLDCGK